MNVNVQAIPKPLLEFSGRRRVISDKVSSRPLMACDDEALLFAQMFGVSEVSQVSLL